MKALARVLGLVCLLLLLWQASISLFHTPHYFLPSPVAVGRALLANAALIAVNASVSLLEMTLGYGLAIVFGMWAALTLAYCRGLRLAVLPLLVFSQAIPTFAIAPLLVLWLGYGLASKILITLLMLFFPILSAFLDGLLAPRPELLDMARLMTPSRWQLLWHIQMPSALPKLATGLRVAAAGAPLAAIIGEWVGASQGLGYLMLEANARLQMDVLFAVLAVLVGLALALYFSIDAALKKWIYW